MKHDDDRLQLPRPVSRCTGVALAALGLRELECLAIPSDGQLGPHRVVVATERGVVDLRYTPKKPPDTGYAVDGSLVGWSDLSLALKVGGGAAADADPRLEWETTINGLSPKLTLKEGSPHSDAAVAMAQFRAVVIERLLPVERASVVKRWA